MSEKIDPKTQIQVLNQQMKMLTEEKDKLKNQVDAEIQKLERLRNEISHLDSQKQALKTAQHDSEDDIGKRIANVEKEKRTVRAVALMNEKESQRLLHLKQTINEKQSEVTEKINNLILRKKEAEELEARVMGSARKLSLSISESQEKETQANKKFEEAHALLAEAVKAKKQNDSESSDLKTKRARLELDIEKQHESFKKKDLRNSLKEQENRIILARAEQVSANSQLSLDRQFNDLEIYKKKLQTVNLRLMKFAKDNKIGSVFEELKKELGI